MGNAWCVKTSSLCFPQQAPLKILPLGKNLSSKRGWMENAWKSLLFFGDSMCPRSFGTKGKAPLTLWCCYHLPSVAYFIPHVCPQVWGEGISLNQGTRSRAVFGQDYLAFSDLHCLSSRKWPLQFVDIHTCMQHTQIDIRWREMLWSQFLPAVSSLWFTSAWVSSQTTKGKRRRLFSATPLVRQQWVLRLKRGGAV